MRAVGYISEVARILAAPGFFLLRLARAGLLSRTHDGPVISLSPRVNTVNDQTTILLQADWIRRYGIFGKHWNSKGVSLGLGHHPPLGKLLFLGGGIRGYFMISMLLYVGAFGLLTALSGHLLLLVLLPYIFLSPYFKNNAVVIGRFDFPAWPFFIAALSLWLNGYFFGTLISAVCGALIHPTILLLAPICLGMLTIGDPDHIPRLLLFGLLYGLALASWVIPFFRARQYTGVARLQWRFGKLVDATRSVGVMLKKLGFYLPFLFAVFRLCPVQLTAVVLVPAMLMLGSLHKEQFVNRFSLEMLIVAIGALVVFQTPHIVLAGTYLLAIYGYASPSPRADFPLRAVTLSKADRQRLADFYQPLPTQARLLYMPLITNADDMRLSAKYNILLCLPGLRTERQEFVGGACLSPGAGLPPHPHNVYLYMNRLSPDHLRAETIRHGIGYLIAFAGPVKDMLDEYGYHQISRVDFAGVGSVPPATIYLYRCPQVPAIVEPAAELAYEANAFSFQAERSGSYHVKYLYYPAWRAYLDGRRLDIEFNEYGMFVDLPAAGQVTFKYRYRYCWERFYRARYRPYDEVGNPIRKLSLALGKNI